MSSCNAELQDQGLSVLSMGGDRSVQKEPLRKKQVTHRTEERQRCCLQMLLFLGSSELLSQTLTQPSNNVFLGHHNKTKIPKLSSFYREVAVSGGRRTSFWEHLLLELVVTWLNCHWTHQEHAPSQSSAGTTSNRASPKHLAPNKTRQRIPGVFLEII